MSHFLDIGLCSRLLLLLWIHTIRDDTTLIVLFQASSYPVSTKFTLYAFIVVVVVVLLLTTKSHTNRSHVSNIFRCVVIYSINIFVYTMDGF